MVARESGVVTPIGFNVNRTLGLHQDRRETPMYRLAEVADYIDIPESTLQSWVYGRPYTTRAGRQQFQPLIEIADSERGLLSFYNVVEAHILLSTRQVHGIRMDKIRTAIDYVKQQFPFNAAHPLITQEFYTDGKHLFLKTLAETINASKGGQVALSSVMDEYLELIDRDVQGMPVKLYPKSGNRSVVLNPALSSGRPVLKGTGVLASLIAQRVAAGESIEDLAQNYGVAPGEVRAAVEYARAA